MNLIFILTDTGENVQKWTRVFSTRRWVILVARTRRKKKEENSVYTFWRFRLWTSLESTPYRLNTTTFYVTTKYTFTKYICYGEEQIMGHFVYVLVIKN